jgi:hypothetical protein
MRGVTQVFIASPSLMALAMFSGTLGHGAVPGSLCYQQSFVAATKSLL